MEWTESIVDAKKILEAVKEKIEAIEFKLNNLANGFKAMKGCMKEWKEAGLLLPSSLSEEEFVKREVIK